MPDLSLFELILGVILGLVLYAVVIRMIPGTQPAEELVDKIVAALDKRRIGADPSPAPVSPPAPSPAPSSAPIAPPAPVPAPPPVTVPGPIPIPMLEPAPAPAPAPPVAVTPPPPAPAPTGLPDTFIDRDDLMKRLGAGYVYAVMLDDRPVHAGFGPPDLFYSWPDGRVSRVKPQFAEVEIPIETA